MVELSKRSCTVTCRVFACTALKSRIMHSKAKSKRFLCLYILKYRPLLIFEDIGSNLRYRRDPVQKHSFYKNRHKTTSFLNRILETPAPVSINREERFPFLHQFSLLCMQEDPCTRVVGSARRAGKTDKRPVVHIDNISGCGRLHNKLVLTRNNIGRFYVGIAPLDLDHFPEFFKCFAFGENVLCYCRTLAPLCFAGHLKCNTGD